MPLFSLLYVSRSLLTAADADRQIQRIIEISIPRNSALEVTGALIFTGRRFAQVLEGRRAAVEELMDSIRRDPRHHEVTIVDQGAIAARRFAGWSIAYSGRALFVDRVVLRTLDAKSGSHAAGAELIKLMRTFTGNGRR